MASFAGSPDPDDRDERQATTPTKTDLPGFPMQCQGEVFAPAKFRDKTLKIRVFEGSPAFTNIPATIEWTDARFQVAPARHPIETVAPVYREVTENIPVLRQRIEIIGKPAKYRTVSKPVTIKDAHRAWRANCVAADPQQCLTRVPAKIRQVQQQIIDIPARTVQVKTPEKTVALKRKILISPGQGTGKPIPAQYKTIKIGRVSKTWQVLSEHQPSRFEEIPLRVMITPETIRRTATLCTDKAGKDAIMAIQRRLLAQGYQTETNGILGTGTLRAIIKFQQENDLLTGAITMETLRKLGFR